MKEKRLDRDIWTTIRARRYVQKQLPEGPFGVSALLYLDEVDPPSIWHVDTHVVPFCRDGVKWLQFADRAESYLVTAVFDEENRITVWYVDMIDGLYFDPDGVAVYRDLYLDVLFLPDGHYQIDDEDELQEALRTGDVSEAQVDLAHRTKDRILREYVGDIPGFMALCLELFSEMEAEFAKTQQGQ